MVKLELIEECRKGNLRNFHEVVRTASPFAFTLAFRILGDEELAKDIVQETMVTIWKKMDKIKSSESFKTWLYRIVVNKCYDQIRKKKRNPEQRADESTWNRISNHFSSEQTTALDNSEISILVNLLTESLSPKQKAVFVLSDLEEMTSEEIAGITGMTKINVKSNLHHARKKIREMIIKYQ